MEDTKYLDELFFHKENGKVVIKAWVRENDTWGYRILTFKEIKQIAEGSLTVQGFYRDEEG